MSNLTPESDDDEQTYYIIARFKNGRKTKYLTINDSSKELIISEHPRLYETYLAIMKDVISIKDDVSIEDIKKCKSFSVYSFDVNKSLSKIRTYTWNKILQRSNMSFISRIKHLLK